MSTQTRITDVLEDPELARASTISSLSPTNDSTSTEWGPGTIFGRVLLGFGEAVKDGFDNIIIRRRLNTLNSLFSHEQSLPSTNLSQIYDDVLELSRPGLYRDQVRQQALSILLAQISVRQTEPLLLSLGKWPNVEIQLFLAQIVACMPEEWSQEETAFNPMYRHLTNVYISSQKQDERHTALPFFDFLAQLCQGNQAGGQAVLDTGFLDLLVSMLVRDFSIPNMNLKRDEADECRSMVLEVCHSLLIHLSAHADLFLVLANHPICAIWPRHHLFHRDLAMSADARWRKRRSAWKQVDESLVDDRLKSIPALYEASPGDIRELADLEDVCVDLLEFLGQADVYGTRLSCLARSCIFEYITLGGRRCEALASVLSSSSYEENFNAFINIISYLLSLRQALPPLNNSTTRNLSENSFTRPFLLVCISASKRSDTVRRALIASGMVHLLLSVISDLIPDQPFLPLEYEERDSIPLLLINCEALSDVAQDKENHSPDDASDNWRKHLRQAVIVLLSIKDVVIHQESHELSEPLFDSSSSHGYFTFQWNQWRFVCRIRTLNPSFILPQMLTLPAAGSVLEYTISIQQRLSVAIDPSGKTIKSSSSYILARRSCVRL